MTVTNGQTPAVWLTLDEADWQGLRIPAWVWAAIGPRRVGTVYRSGYWGTVNTVTAVRVKVGRIRLRGGRMVPAAVSYEITEYDGDDVRDRSHMTAWHYPVDLHGRPDVVLQGPGDTRPRRERGRA
ncbi:MULTISPECIES: hypothetical protein [Streptomyces]|uniref:hypothetical protein n=1 Tax=Streptomyces TaxID=1883 RepID=UPI00366309CB